MIALRPLNMTLNKQEHYLEIQWSDDQTCRYPLSELREACPCVECRGGHAFMGSAHDPDNLLELKPACSYMMVALQQVGNYAVQPTWDDGHATGIYTWDYLRKLCPTEEPEDDG